MSQSTLSKQKSRIAVRSRNMNTILLALVLFLMTIMAAVIINSINSDRARNTVRTYSMEAAEKFYAYISQDLTLVRKAAHSKAITAWFADEEDEAKKTLAFDELVDYAAIMQGNHFYLGIQESMNEYSLMHGHEHEYKHGHGFELAFADVVSHDKLDQSRAEDAWYFECIESDNDYSITIDIEKAFQMWHMWINHKVMADGNLVGVFCSGLRVPDVFYEIFDEEKYNEKQVIGYIINKHGVIQSSSINHAIYFEEDNNHIHEESSDSVFAAVLGSYLGNIKGVFGPHSRPEVIKLAKGPFQYAAIEPISSTDWSVVVLYNTHSLAGIANLMPLLIVMLIILLIYVVGRNALMNYLIFTPLNRLTQSVSKGDFDFFGSGRNDEIGELAQTIREMRDGRQRQEQLLHAVNSTAAALLAPSEEENFEASLMESMEFIGLYVDVDRIIIWRNDTIDEIFYYAKQFQWLRSDTGRVGRSAVTMRPYSEIPEWERKFLMNEYINGPLSTRTQEEQDILGPQGVKSILAIPLYWNRQFYGFFSFDDCHKERTFTIDEVNILRSAGLMMVSALNRNMQAVQLRQAHQYTQILLDTMPLTCTLFHKDAKIFDCNEAAINQFKVKSKQEFIDRFWELSPEYQNDGQSSFEKAGMNINKAFAEGSTVFEWMHQAIDGTPIPMEVTLVRVKLRDDDVVAGYSRDLREYKQMMNEIERGANLLNTVNQAATILLQSEIDEFQSNIHRCMGMIAKAVGFDRVTIWKNHTRDGRLYCSEIYEWAGNAEPHIHSETAIDEPYDEKIPGWEEILSQGKCIKKVISEMSAAEQATLSPRGILSIFVAPVFVHDTFWGFVGFDDCHSETLYTESEESTLLSGSMLIATALLRNEIMLSLRTTAAKLETVIANYPGVIWSVDQNNMITLFDGLYLNQLGFKQEFFKGKKFDEALQEEQFTGFSESVYKTFTDGPQDWNSEINNKVYRIRTTPIYDNSGKVANVMGSFDDITERTLLQAQLKIALNEAQKANNAKSNFLANMSHEMRTPLNAIIGLSELTLDASELDEEASLNLEKIYNAGMTLLSTVNDILDISKIEAGKLELMPVEYDIPSLINDAITQSIMRIGEKPIRFVMDIDENLPTRLYGDDLRIKQILNNLLSNAFKYTKEGTVELDISSEREEGSVWLTARVSDTGMGISSKNLVNLFTDYAQVDAASNRKIEGTGLGLPITKRVAEMMDGSVSVESEYGKGSVFTVRVRQKFVSDAVIGAEVVKNLKNFRHSDNKRQKDSHFSRIKLPYARVLVVDDVTTNLDVAKGMMKPYGMQIDCVASGQEAIDAIREEKITYNAVFMDHMMPGMDGIEATRIIREEIGTEYAKTIPIIALTANAIVGNEEMFLNNGFQAFLSKPIEIVRLDTVIREWIRNKDLEKSLAQISEDEQTISNRRSGHDRRKADRKTGGIDRQAFRKKIIGLDVDKGIERFDGDEESYLQVLHSYAASTPPLLEELKEVTEESLTNYAIIVHGIKSSSQGICADRIGSMAEALEKAAKEGNYNFVTVNSGDFIKTTEKLIDAIDDMLRQMILDNPKPKKDKPDNIVLSKILAASKTYNMDEVDAAMLEIENWEYESGGELVAWLRENVDQMNFKQIREKLSTIAN
ncbi:MAG: ATP-binding protein [Treponema sp.]|nr:ATP-binding protein [Treponema sp.]